MSEIGDGGDRTPCWTGCEQLQQKNDEVRRLKKQCHLTFPTLRISFPHFVVYISAHFASFSWRFISLRKSPLDERFTRQLLPALDLNIRSYILGSLNLKNILGTFLLVPFNFGAQLSWSSFLEDLSRPSFDAHRNFTIVFLTSMLSATLVRVSFFYWMHLSVADFVVCGRSSLVADSCNVPCTLQIIFSCFC